MRELLLLWHSFVSQEYILIGKLTKTEKKYMFVYDVEGATKAHREGCTLPFRTDKRTYESERLFPFFKHRLMNVQRESYRNYLKSLGLNENDEFKMLQITKGIKISDNFQVVTPIEYETIRHNGNAKTIK